jgi:predicted permease
MKALPGVTSVAVTSTLPLTGSLQWSVAVDGRPEAMRELPTPHIVIATHDVFRALGIRLVRGRAFGDGDRENTELVTIVNQTMAKVYWPGDDPIGKRIHLSGPPQWMTVVGVAADVRLESLSELPRPAYYVLTPQYARMTGMVEGTNFVVRTANEPQSIMNATREVIREQDPELAVHNMRTLDALVTESVARPRFAASVLGAFGISALLLAVVGVYGVLSYAMERRRRELAVRMALGAQPGQVRRLVIASALTLAGAGIVAGLLASLAGKRIIATLLYEVSPTDIITLAGVSAALLGAALLASWIPARRATTVSPAEVLRGE